MAGVIMKMILYLCSQGDRPQTIAITRNETAGSSRRKRERKGEGANEEKKEEEAEEERRAIDDVLRVARDLKRKRTATHRRSIACK